MLRQVLLVLAVSLVSASIALMALALSKHSYHELAAAGSLADHQSWVVVGEPEGISPVKVLASRIPFFS